MHYWAHLAAPQLRRTSVPPCCFSCVAAMSDHDHLNKAYSEVRAAVNGGSLELQRRARRRTSCWPRCQYPSRLACTCQLPSSAQSAVASDRRWGSHAGMASPFWVAACSFLPGPAGWMGAAAAAAALAGSPHSLVATLVVTLMIEMLALRPRQTRLTRQAQPRCRCRRRPPRRSAR